MELNKIYHLDFLDNTLPDKCANLIIADPPYFETKGEFDFIWKSFDHYLADVEKWAIECKRILADNGTIIWFGDAKNIAYSQIIFDKYFNLLNSCVWENTNNHKQQIRFNTGLRSFAPITERFLVYELLNDKTGNEIVHDLFLKHNNPFSKQIREARLKKGVSIKDVAEYGKFYRNVNHGGSVTNWELGYNIPSINQWALICEYLPIENDDYYSLLKEYENIRLEYESKRRQFNNINNYGDVIRLPNYDTKKYKHDTIKPEKLMIDLIVTCSSEDGLVVVPFAGSGTECVASIKNKRPFIGFDINENYVNIANERCKLIMQEQTLF